MIYIFGRHIDMYRVIMKKRVYKTDDNRIKTNVYRTGTLSLVLVAAAVTLGGCGIVSVPELTEEQTALVTEYAAGLILKYDTLKPEDSLLDEEELNEQAAAEALKRQKEREAKAAAEDYLAKKANASKEKDPDKNADKKDDSSGKKDDAEQAVGDLAQFYGMNDFSIAYEGYELTDSYPTSGDDMLMAMDATDGKTLCVLKFSVTNNSSADTVFDMFYRNPNFYLSIDGGEKVHQQYTLLLDDMAASNDTFAAGQTQQRVLIFEIPQDASVGTMSLQAKNSEGQKGTMHLQ